MKALVTGSAGFLGRHFVHELRTRGWDVDGIDIEPMAYPGNLDWDEGQGLIRTTQGDVMDAFRMTLQHGTKLYDLVVHAAAMAPNRLGIDRIPTSHIHNRMLDAAMFDWAIRTGQARVLYLSSCVVLDRELDPYGETKLAGEKMAQLARRAGTPVTIVRPFSGYGSDQSTDFPFPAFVRRVLAWEDPFTIWGDGGQVRDWIHVDDVVRGALAVVDSNMEDPIQLCSGVGTSMFDLTRLMHRMAGQDPQGVSYSFLGDMPTGPTRRVGDPRGMLQLYTPTVSLEQGIKRALSEHSQVGGHPHWCAHQYPHPRQGGCSVIHRRDCDCKD